MYPDTQGNQYASDIGHKRTYSRWDRIIKCTANGMESSSAQLTRSGLPTLTECRESGWTLSNRVQITEKVQKDSEPQMAAAD